MYLSQYLGFGDTWGLYTHYHDITRATRRKLVVVMAYKDLFGGIFGQRAPSDGLQYVVHEWSSDTIYLIPTNFSHKIMSITIANDRI